MPVISKLQTALSLIRQSRREKRNPKARFVVGLIGRAETAIAPDGTIFVRGLLWAARAHVPIEIGESVRVIGLSPDRLALVVEHLPS